jgi:CPA1 family monovalent cation:H+ antiporter
LTVDFILGLATIVFAGILAQWMSWRLHVPSILLLLVFGLLIGPVFGFIQPDALFGDLLFPLVSLAVGIILFEGGLGLRVRDLTGIKHVVRNLISVGLVIT